MVAFFRRRIAGEYECRARGSERRRSDEKEMTMLPMEGFSGRWGQGLVVSQAARKLAEEDERWTIRPVVEAAVIVIPPTRRERILAWAGDLFLTAGMWLKARSVVAS
jgi:hypothetical protein